MTLDRAELSGSVLRIASGTAFVLLTAGCFPSYVGTTTEVRLHDPARASVRTASLTTLLPEGRNATEVPLDRGWLRVPDGAPAPVAVTAVREADGAIAFDYGSRAEVVDAEGKVIPLGEDAISARDLRAPVAALALCCAPRPTSRAGVALVSGACSFNSGFHGALVSSWDNVISIRRRTRNTNRVAAIGGASLLTTFHLAPATALLVIGVTSSPGPDRTGPLVGSGLFFGGAIAVFSLFAPAMFASDRTEIIYPAPAPR